MQNNPEIEQIVENAVGLARELKHEYVLVYLLTKTHQLKINKIIHRVLLAFLFLF